MEKPHLDEPDMEIPTQINTNIINTKEQIDKGDKTKSSFFVAEEHNVLTLLDENGQISTIDCIFSTGKYKSKSEVRRLIQQGALKIDGEKSQELFISPKNDSIIQVGKGNAFKLVDLNEKNQIIDTEKNFVRKI